MRNNLLKIKEIFYSIQGESSFAGIPTVFVRLTGCPLRCNYCDTAYAFHGGSNMQIPEILNQVKQYPTKYVCVTGGEPLAQSNCKELITTLCNNNYIVSVETSGALDISCIDPKAITILDIKTPDSGEVEKNLWQNIEKLKPKDQVKFVVSSKQDFFWVINILKEYKTLAQQECIVSPVFGKVDPKELANWLLENPCKLRMQIQMHKVIWGEEPGR